MMGDAMAEQSIADRTRQTLASLPPHVLLVAASKTRTPEEVRAAAEVGVTAVGHNYVQEAETMRQALSEWESQRAEPLRWHLIGHLQRNKARRAVSLFDMIETVDSLRIAQAVDRHCAEIGKVMPVLIEVNSGRESSKTGVPANEVEALARQIARLEHLRLHGVMTMGPQGGDPEDARPYFRLTKELFDRLAALRIENVEMRFLSMGMSNSYLVAIEEGANVVRLGTRLFGARPV